MCSEWCEKKVRYCLIIHNTELFVWSCKKPETHSTPRVNYIKRVCEKLKGKYVNLLEGGVILKTIMHFINVNSLNCNLKVPFNYYLQGVTL